MKKIKLLAIVCWIIAGVLYSRQTVRADEYCGEGSTCQGGVERTATGLTDCSPDRNGICLDDVTPTTGTCLVNPGGGCPNGAAHCCGFYYKDGRCNYNTCTYYYKNPQTFSFYSCCTGGEDSCFPAGTKVLMGDKSQEEIENVKVGDKVVSQSEDGKKSVSTVTKLDQPVRDQMCQIKFTDGENLKLTDEHPLFTQDGWKAINPQNTFKEVPDLAVNELKQGDRISKSDGTSAEVGSFGCWSEKIQTYNLILDNGANTYFADGFLVHNKGTDLVNCKNLTINGSSTLVTLIKGTTYTLDATYDFYGTSIKHKIMAVASATNCDYKWIDRVPPYPSPLFEWIPTTAGTYTIYCVNLSEGYGACIGFPACKGDGGTSCNGGNAWRPVTVVEPSPSPSPSHSPSPSPSHSPSPSPSHSPSPSPSACPSCGGCSSPANHPGYWATWTEANSACPAQIFCSGPSYTCNPTACPCTCTNTLSGISNTYKDASGNWLCYSFTPTNCPGCSLGTATCGGTSWPIYPDNYYQCVFPSPSPSPSPSSTPSCTVFLIPASGSVSVGESMYFNANVSYSGGTVDRVDFSSLNTGIATVNPSSDTTVVYRTYATGEVIGSAQIQANVIMGGLNRCSDTSIINVTNIGAWWQAVGGNIHADGGNVSSNIPGTATEPYLITEAENGTTGLVSYTDIVDTDEGGISEDGHNWQAQTTYNGTRTGYEYFKRILEDDPAAINDWNGSEPATSGVFLGTGISQTIGGNWSIGSGTKAVILVPNDLTITQNISVAQGGFLAIIASGKISVDPGVTNLEGVYITDDVIETGVSTSQLQAEGIFAGWGVADFKSASFLFPPHV